MDSAVTSIPEGIARFRADYRASEVSPRYSGALHFAYTTGLSLAVMAACAWCLARSPPLSVAEWLTVPLTLALANFIEYHGHRGPMHHPTRGLRLLFERQAVDGLIFSTSLERYATQGMCSDSILPNAEGSAPDRAGDSGRAGRAG